MLVAAFSVRSAVQVHSTATVVVNCSAAQCLLSCQHAHRFNGWILALQAWRDWLLEDLKPHQCHAVTCKAWYVHPGARRHPDCQQEVNHVASGVPLVTRHALVCPLLLRNQGRPFQFAMHAARRDCMGAKVDRAVREMLVGRLNGIRTLQVETVLGSFVQSPPRTRSLAHSPTYSLDSFTQSINQSSNHSTIYMSCDHPFMHSYACSYSHSFMHSLTQPLTGAGPSCNVQPQSAKISQSCLGLSLRLQLNVQGSVGCLHS